MLLSSNFLRQQIDGGNLENFQFLHRQLFLLLLYGGKMNSLKKIKRARASVGIFQKQKSSVSVKVEKILTQFSHLNSQQTDDVEMRPSNE